MMNHEASVTIPLDEEHTSEQQNVGNTKKMTPTASPSSYRRNMPQEEYNSYLMSVKKTDQELSQVNKKTVKEYYENQNEVIDSLVEPFKGAEEDEAAHDLKVQFAVRASLVANVLLFAMQLVGAIWSHSLSLVSTTIDAFMDILSNSILLGTDIWRRKKNVHKYPVGKTRMEPIGIIVFASLMSFMSLQLVRETVSALIADNPSELHVDIVPIALVASAIGLKVILYLYCRVLKSPTGATLAQDHRNDIVLNVFGLGMAILGHYIRWWVDPMGGLLIALLILRSWGSTAYEQMMLLVGRAAPASTIHKLTYIAMHHDDRILKVDTCRAFFVGNNIFVELDIVLPPTMPLRESHDIAESLQKKLESITEVERAFVHADYEYDHKAEDEHKHPM